MLDGLDRIDWGALRTAHGPATDVPRHLAGLASADAGDREAALEALYASLWHQGTLYPATPAAVPFVLALVDDERTPDRPSLLLYLADLGRAAAMGDDPWYADTQQALAAGVPILERRLAAEDEVERISATVALAWADDGTVLAKRLAVHAPPGTRDDAERLVALYALVAGRAVPDGKTFEPFTRDADPGIRLAARIGLVRAGGVKALGEIAPDAYALLAEVAATIAPQALPQPIELVDPTTLSPTTLRGLAGVLAHATTARPALPLVSALLEAVLPDGYEEPLSGLQHDVLAAVATSSGAWVFEGNTLAALAEHGLEVLDRTDLCARLGIDRLDVPEAEDTQSLLAGGEETGIRYEELTDAQRKTLDRFVAFLDDRGWNESRNWHAFVTSGSGYAISPIGVGRHFNEKAVLECTLWFFDEHHAADHGGERIGEPYVRLLIADKAERKEPIGFRGYFGADLEGVLGAIDRHRKTVDRENFAERFLHDLFDVATKVEVELADGRVAEIRPKSR